MNLFEAVRDGWDEAKGTVEESRSDFVIKTIHVVYQVTTKRKFIMFPNGL